jgi:Fur family ferric uptake transcriptional regulator
VADDTVAERFRAFLRERGLPVTSQRLVIAELMLHAPGHLSADDLAALVQEKGHKVGLATIYRTIDLLVASGLVVERDFGEGFRRFEPARDIPQHYRLSCTVCGAVVEFLDERIAKIIRSISTARGFAHSQHRLVVHGTCRDCRRTTLATDHRRMS